MSHYFFLSYARPTDHGQVTRFFEELSEAIREKEGLEGEVGFFDRDGIKLGENWPEELKNALRTCRTMVCLYAPIYFKREQCGKEWQVFHWRLEKYQEANKKIPPNVLPIIWLPIEQQHIPPHIAGVQYLAKNAEYAKNGLRHLFEYDQAKPEYKIQYGNFIRELANQIVEVGKQYQIPDLPLEKDLDWNKVPNYFLVKDEILQKGTPEQPKERRTRDTVEPVPKRLTPFQRNSILVTAIVVGLLLALVVVKPIYENYKMDKTPVTDDLDPRKFQIIGEAIAWNLDTIEANGERYKGWRVFGEGLGLIKAQSKNSFNLYRDFTVNFNVRLIRGQGFAWVVHAKDSKNYYLFSLSSSKLDDKGRRLDFYICKNGQETFQDSHPLSMSIEENFVSLDITTVVAANKFTHTMTVNSDNNATVHPLGTFEDKNSLFESGGVGFRSRPGMEVLVQQIVLTPK